MNKNRRFEGEAEEKKSTAGFGMRHVQCLLLFAALFVAFATRLNISMAIVAMTGNNASIAANSTELNYSQHQQYNWNERTKSYVLSSFFWGYFVTQIPGGHYSHKYGGKYLLLQALLVTGVLTTLTPLAVRYGNWQWLCVFRLIQGLAQGVLFPSIHSILSKWSPVEERNTLGTYCYIGSKFGTCFMLAISGTLASSSFGWPSIFYVSGGMGLLWSVAWFIWGASAPNDCKRITVAEKSRILNSQRHTLNVEDCSSTLIVPWGKILTSAPFWVLSFVNCAHSWGLWTLLTQTPTFMKYGFGVEIKSNALLSALPHVAFIVLGASFCWLGRLLEKHHWSSLLTNRKMFTTISLLIPAVALVALGYVSAARVDLAVLILVITMGSNSAYFVGWNMNHIELSPNFTGILMGITNFFATIMCLFAPLFVGVIVNDETNLNQWRIVFIVAATLYLLSNLFFLIFGSVTTQPWNEPQIKAKKVNEVKFTKVATEPKDLP